MSAAALIATNGLAAPAIAQPRTKIRLGHLHAVAVDGHILTGIDLGSFERQGIDFELTAFDTGPETFEAMAARKLTSCRRAVWSPTTSRAGTAGCS